MNGRSRRTRPVPRLLPALGTFLLAMACDGDPSGPGGRDPGVPSRYTVVPIGAPPGVAPGALSPVAINDRGQVLLGGYPYWSLVLVWTDGQFTSYTPPWAGSPAALNDAGQLVGYTGTPGSYPPPAEQRPFLGENGRIWYLAGPGLGRARALGINDAGTVVGAAGRPGGERAFILSQGQVTFVEVPGDTASEAVAVNGREQVLVRTTREVRSGLNVSGLTRSHLWRNGQLVSLGPLEWPAAEPGYVADVSRFSIVARDLNERGEVVGDSHGMVCTPDNSRCYSRWRAFLWRGGKMVDLGKSHPASNSSAVAVNRWGHALVRVHASPWSIPLLWSDGEVRNLREAVAGTGWDLLDAHDINDRGQVLGRAQRTGTSEHAVVRLDPA